MNRLKTYILYIAAIAILSPMVMSCDNEENVDPSVKDIFVKYYGAEGDQEGIDVEVLADGYLLIGNSKRTGGTWEIFIVRTDFFGNRVFYQTFQPAEGFNVKAVDAEINDSGNIYVAFEVEKSSSDFDIGVAQFDGSGNSTNQVMHGDASFSSRPSSITVTSTGDILVTGYTNDLDTNKPTGITDESDILTLRFNPDLTPYTGNWRSVFGNRGNDQGIKTVEVAGGFVTLATSEFFNDPQTQDNLNVITYSFDNSGVPTGDGFTAFGGLNNDLGRDISPTNDGGFVILGNTDSNLDGSGTNLPRIIRNFAGNYISDVTINKPEILAKTIREASSGGFLISGTWTSATESSVYVARISNANEIVWNHTYGILDNNFGSRVAETSDGSVLIIGTINLENQLKMCLIKTNPQGELIP